MPREVPGVLELSYARSSGTGDQPVQGLVTSRRDRGKQERQKLIQQKREEEERQNKERQKAAKILRRRWAEEDRGKEEKRKRRQEGEKEERDGDEEEEVLQRLRAAERIREQEAVTDDQGQNQVRAEDMAPEQEQSGGWQQVEDRKDEGRIRLREPPSSASSSMDVRVQEPPEPPRTAPKKKTNVFGFGLEEDEDPRRELELLAEKQRVKARRSSEALSVASPTGATVLAAPSAQPLDAYQQLKKLAEWKRNCNGERRPMPKEMMMELAAVAERQGGRHTT